MLSPHLLPTLNNQFLQKLLSSELRFLVSPQKDKTKIKCRKNSAPEAYKGPQHQQYLLLQQPINPTIFERKWAVDLQKTLKGTDNDANERSLTSILHPCVERKSVQKLLCLK